MPGFFERVNLPGCGRSFAYRGEPPVFLELTEHGFEVLGLAEIPIDRGEADIGDVVELAQMLHHDLADRFRRNLGFATALKLTHDGRYHFLDQIKLELHARGSLSELLDDLNVCEDGNYLPVNDLKILKENAREVQRLINGYIRYLRVKKSRASLLIRESAEEDGSDVELNALCNDLTL